MSHYQNQTFPNITHITQIPQQNDKHQQPLGVCCNQITIFFAIFTEEMVFSFPYFHFATVKVYRRNTFIQRPKSTSTWKALPYSYQIYLQRRIIYAHKISGKAWQLQHWSDDPGLLDVRIHYRMKLPFLLVPQILHFSIMLCHLSHPGNNSMFAIWICGLRKLQEYKCFVHHH